MRKHLMLTFDPAILYQDCSPAPGSADLVVGGNTDEVVGRVAAFVLTAVRRPDGGRAFPRATIIAPPRRVWDRSDDHIHRLVVDAIEFMRGSPAALDEIDAIGRIVTVRRTQGLQVDDVLHEVQGTGTGHFLLVPWVHIYVDATVPAPRRGGADDVPSGGGSLGASCRSARYAMHRARTSVRKLRFLGGPGAAASIIGEPGAVI